MRAQLTKTASSPRMFGTKSGGALDRRHATIGEVATVAIASAATQFLQAEALIGSSDDAEAVHRARVGVRKLRSHLRTFLAILDASWAERLREQLRTIQDVLAPMRDTDVFAERLAALCATLPARDAAAAHELLTTVRAQREKQREALRRTMLAAEYRALVDELVAALRAPRLREDGAAARDAMALVMAKALKSARKAVHDAGAAPSDAALHRIRIKSKHLRYAAEAFACIAGRKARHFAKHVQRLQDVLGEQHDGAVAVQRLRSLEASALARFAAGELAQLASDHGNESAKHWRRAWHATCRKKNRFW